MTEPMPVQEPVAMSDADAVDAVAEILNREPESDAPQEPEEATIEPEGAAEPEVEAAEVEDEPEEGEVEQQFENIEQLAEAVGLDPDQFMQSIKMPIKVNGEISYVSLADAQKGQRLEADYTHKTQELARQRDEFRAYEQEQRQLYEQNAQIITSMLNVEHQQLQEQYNNIPWDNLRQTDPAEFAALDAEFRRRDQAIRDKWTQAQDGYQRYQNQLQQKHIQQVGDLTKQAIEVLAQEYPEWRSEDARSEEVVRLRDFLGKIGYAENELGGVTDHRFIRLAKLAQDQYTMKQAKVSADQKKPVKKTRTLKPGTRKISKGPNQSKYKQAMKKAQKSQNVDDWTNALMEKMNL